MKFTFLLLTFSSIFLVTDKGRDCSNSHSSADDAYSYSKKAYNSDSWEESKSYLKKAMNSFEDAISYAQDDDCKCEDAVTAAEEGYRFAKKGYNSTDWEETKDYSRKAKNYAEETITDADECED